MNRVLVSDVRSAIALLVGEECWNFSAGPGTGSAVVFDFGGKIKKERLDGLNAPDKYEGEFALYVQCSWRIEKGLSVVTSCWDNGGQGDAMTSWLRQLLFSKIVESSVEDIGADLILRFDNGFIFRAFCDQVDEGSDNYVFFDPLTSWIVGPCGQLGREMRKI